MALDDTIEETPLQRFRKRSKLWAKNRVNDVYHYLSYTERSIYNSLIKVPFASTAIRRGLERRLESEVAKRTYLEEVIDFTTGMIAVPTIISAAIINNWVLVGLVGSNAFNLAIESSKIKLTLENLLCKLDDEQSDGTKKSNSPRYSLIRILPRRLSQYVLSGLLATGLAIGVESGLRAMPRHYGPSLVNIRARECSLEKDGSVYKFYIAGEKSHAYNYSSYIYARHLIKQSRPNVLLMEGTPPTSGYSNADLMLGFSLVPRVLSGNMVYSGIEDICERKGIPIVYLEKPDPKTGIQGITKTEYYALYVGGCTSIALAPFTYFWSLPSRWLSVPGGEMPIGVPGLVTQRSKNMADASVDYIVINPTDTPLICVGDGHVDGMFRFFGKHGRLSSTPMNVRLPAKYTGSN